MSNRLAYILVGDHLGQVKKVLPENGELSLISGCATASSSNPVVSIESLAYKSKHLIANRNGELYIYDSIHDKTKACNPVNDNLNKALPAPNKKFLLIYDKLVSLNQKENLVSVKQKKSEIKNAQIHDSKLAIVGKDIPLKLIDIEKKTKVYEANPPEKDWLGIQPDIYVSGLDFVGQNQVATCSKSDSVIRVYDTRSKPAPAISINIDQTAFNEHADSSRFISLASTGESGHSIVVGSNVGQILAIDLRLNVKQVPKKKLQPRNYKIIGGFKGARGGSIKDIKVTTSYKENEEGYKVISCCLDRYLRIHDFTRNSRYLDKHVYMNTKPLCCSPVFYND